MLLNISTDEVFLWENDISIQIHRNLVDQDLWPSLVKQYRDHNLRHLLVINWPGGFTNLRVGCLCVNMLNSLIEKPIRIQSITKLKIYKYLYKENILPRYGVIYIWQKKNVRLYDFQLEVYNTINKSELPDDIEVFYDLVYEEGYYNTADINMVNIKYEDEILKVIYKDQEHDIDLQPPIKYTIKPQYMVEPVIWNSTLSDPNTKACNQK